ncbi:ARM repeat-containing protein [Polychaeton citri CBS 116435]|uniref:ARM repeat-containing protein n=1 Tax=Polychaeton citri CBS 116435 TaxID=1314669 RepID=A0A9P4Q3W9_9PEZI|nr:ARM repeat-containing protein [Polychaeton citri CBS 116435]
MSEPDSRPDTAASSSSAKISPNGDRPQPSLSTLSPLQPYQLDVKKLHALPSQQQELYLLAFTSNLAKHIEELDDDGCSAEQLPLKKEILQIITLPSPTPARVVRQNLGRCFAGIFRKGSRKLLYESINDLVAIINASVKEKGFRAKHAAVHCLGTVFETAGDSALSLSPLASTALLKLFKAAANDTGLRSAIFRALGRIIKGIVAAIDDDIGRAIWKQARNTAGSDKSLLVQASACFCLERLVHHTTYFDNSNDFEKLQLPLWRVMEGSVAPVRHSAASCLAAVLVKSYSESPSKDAVPRIKKPRKTKKNVKPEDGEDEVERSGSPVPEKPATTLSYNLREIMRVLGNQYCKPVTSNRGRAAIAVCYIKVFRALGESVVEQNYNDIASHLFRDILNHAGMQFNKYRQLISRKFVRIILEHMVGKMLGETAQLKACRFLINDILKDFPQAVKERPEPSKAVLLGAVSTLTAFIGYLDAGINEVSELCREALLQVLQHPSYTVQVYSARALRTFVLACPQQLLPTVTICMNSVHRELGLLAGPRQSPRRCIGYALGLAATISTSNHHQLYGSVEVYSRVLQQATNLLKYSGSSDLRISSCQLQVAWIMIGGLMTLGPNFVKIHLSQLMLLWKNALPRPVSKDHISQRTMLELSYLSHVRECALGSMKAFPTFNQRLLTSDVSKRLSIMLENTVSFLSSLPDKRTSEDPANRLSPALQLQDYEVMVRRRVLQCFSQLLTLSPAGSIEITAHSTILPLAVATFSDAEYSAPNSLSIAIASAAGSFDRIWDVADNYGFGVNGLMRGLDVRDPVTKVYQRHWTSRNDEFGEIDSTILSPVCGSPEMDGSTTYTLPNGLEEAESFPCAAATDAVNASLSAFSLCFSLQTARVQESTLEQISSSFSASSLQKDPARKAAIAANTALALLGSLKVATGQSGSYRGDLRGSSTERSLQAILWNFVKDPDDNIRHIAAQALGHLCSSSGTAFTAAEVTQLTELIVNNREPHVRAGCSLALACIHSQLGGMAAGLHMKSIVGILMSLAADTHPLVHFWALDSLASVAATAGLNFSGYVTSSIGMLSQLYVSDGHNCETASQTSSNMSMGLPVSAAIARGVDSIVHVLGPDLQDMTKQRDMVMTLASLFLQEQDTPILLDALKCMEHLSLYAPAHVDFKAYVHRLQADIESTSTEISLAAINGLFALMRRDAPEIVNAAAIGLEERLWECLNNRPDLLAIRNIFMNWLQQTGLIDPVDWIQRCNNILTKTKAKVEQPGTATAKDTAGPDLQDDEVGGFVAAAGGAQEKGGASAPTSTQELMRWQVRLFAMECLHSLISMLSKEASVREDSPGEAALQHKVADVIRIAFSASTAGVVALRVVGMRIIDQILKMFGRTPDPDFAEAMLLEQYQAQISSALTPAFATDSSPELAAEAVNVCATFISTGIVTDVDRMGRILKLLVSALESFSRDTESATIGDLRALSSNAQVMVRMAVFKAWAQLQIASTEQRYLVDVVRPHVSQLAPLWLASLREHARLRFEPDISATTGNIGHSGDLDMVYSALTRQILLRFYQESWLSLVEAIACLIDDDSEFVFAALDSRGEDIARSKPVNGVESGEGGNNNDPGAVASIARKSTGINYRKEPVAFFFVLFGLTFESLATRSNDDDITRKQRNLDILEALKKILRPSVSGNAIYQEIVFSETMDLFDRMILMEGLGIQAVIVEIARNLCIGHPSSRHGMQSSAENESETLSDDIEQLFELTRIIVLVIAGLVPGLSENPPANSTHIESSDEAVFLLRTSLQALVDVSEVFPSIIKTDLHATILHIFVTILGTGICQTAVVPQALPIFRRFIVSIVGDDSQNSADTKSQLRNSLLRMMIILKNAQKRESEASLPCEKNTLLASTILISAATSEWADDTDSILNKYLDELEDCLQSRMTSRVAAGCVRTLLLGGIAPRRLLSLVVPFLVSSSQVEGVEESKMLMAQTLVLYASRLAQADEQKRAAAVALAMHTLLQYAETEYGVDGGAAATRFLELAGVDGVAFRNVVARMDVEQKQKLESILKAKAGAEQQSQGNTGGGEPTIALKMDFGM